MNECVYIFRLFFKVPVTVHNAHNFDGELYIRTVVRSQFVFRTASLCLFTIQVIPSYVPFDRAISLLFSDKMFLV